MTREAVDGAQLQVIQPFSHRRRGRPSAPASSGRAWTPWPASICVCRLKRHVPGKLRDHHPGDQRGRRHAAVISRDGAGACTTALSQPRQPYFGRTVRSTRRIAGTTSSASWTSCADAVHLAAQHGQIVLSGSMTCSQRGRCLGSAPLLRRAGLRNCRGSGFGLPARVVIGGWRRHRVGGQIAEPERHLRIDAASPDARICTKMQGIDRCSVGPQPLVIGVELQHQLGELVGIGGQVLAAQRHGRIVSIARRAAKVDFESSGQNWSFHDRRSRLRPCQSVEQQCQLRRRKTHRAIAIGGQTNLPLSSHFVARTMPLPSHASSLIRSFRFERNTNISPPYGSADRACATSATSPCTPRRKSIGRVATHTRSPARVAIKPGRPAPPPAPATTSPCRHPSPPVCLRRPARSRSRPTAGRGSGDVLGLRSQLRAHRHRRKRRHCRGQTSTRRLAIAAQPARPTACPRHVDNIFAFTPCRAATSATFTPAAKLSATIAALRAADQRRRQHPPSRPSRRQPPSPTMPSIAMPSLKQERQPSSLHARKIRRCYGRSGYAEGTGHEEANQSRSLWTAQSAQQHSAISYETRDERQAKLDRSPSPCR